MQTRIRARRIWYPRTRGYFIPVVIFTAEKASKEKCPGARKASSFFLLHFPNVKARAKWELNPVRIDPLHNDAGSQKEKQHLIMTGDPPQEE
jgi:hypothetical protein